MCGAGANGHEKSSGRLTDDRVVQAAKVARFHGHVVCSPTASDCEIGLGAIGADGYGRLYLTLDGVGPAFAPHRYALAIANGSVAAGVLRLSGCDDPVCAEIADATGARYDVAYNLLERSRKRTLEDVWQQCRGVSHRFRIESCGASNRLHC